MKRIMIDLDVLTNALWKGENMEVAKRFLESVTKEELEILTPAALIDLIFEWNDRKLAKSILAFYSENSDILSQRTILREFEKLGVDHGKVVEELKKVSGKEEDSFLVLVASVFGLEIITFNKKQKQKDAPMCVSLLRGKKDEINRILRRFSLSEVKINEPI